MALDDSLTHLQTRMTEIEFFARNASALALEQKADLAALRCIVRALVATQSSKDALLGAFAKEIEAMKTDMNMPVTDTPTDVEAALRKITEWFDTM